MTATSEPMPLDGFSIAGIETAIEVPGLKLVLDMGRCSRNAVNYPLVLVSHGHLDHAGAVAQHASRRAMMKMSEATYLVPAPIAPQIERLFNAMGDVDGNPIPRRIVPLEPGQDFALANKRWVRPFATFHRVPSQGYTIWERRHRLRQELADVSGPELAALRARGVEVSAAHDVPLLSYTGDTRVEVLEQTEELGRTETLILETSFLDERISVADARVMGHIHLDEVIERAALLPRNDVVFCHFSARYGQHEIRNILDRRLPETLRALVRVLG